MLCLNLVGMGLGPLLVGVRQLTPYYGNDALSVAMSYFALVGFWGSLSLRPHRNAEKISMMSGNMPHGQKS